MLWNSLRQATLSSLAIGSLLPCCRAQGAAASPAPAPAPANDPRLQGLPPFLLLVPGGPVQIGLTAPDLVQTCSQAVSPMKPENASRYPDKFTTAMKRTASTLGQKKVDVETFVLGKWPVTNAEYETYVAHKRALKLKVRAPFSWWRYGAKADYEAKLADIGREFPKDNQGPVLFWERYGHELPYALTDERGQSIADFPVAHLSYTEANEFAGWLGMRLPNEAEWTRAARGDGTHRFPWGTPNSGLPDTFIEKHLEFLGLNNAQGQKPAAIGKYATTAGPYGHQDMFGRIWQLVSGLGYGPINGGDAFADEWKALQKDKAGALLTAPPAWKSDRVLAKGGSYLSWQEPIQLLIDARAPLQTSDVLEGAGFRLAKSLKPGFDMLYSLVRGQYNRGAFGVDQVLDEGAQVGAERYELLANGFPKAYHAVSFMPVVWLSNEKTAELGKLLERTHTSPLLLGTLATTEALANPAVPAGLYTVLYRKEGMTKELAEAIKVGFKEVQAALKKKAKGGDVPAEEGQEPDKKGGWREVCKKAGITEADLEPKEATHGLKFVRIDGVQVPTDTDCFLLMSGIEGKVVAAVPATNHRPAPGKVFVNELLLEKGEKDKAVAKFRFCVPIKATDMARAAEFRLNLAIDCAPPSPEVVWRLPAAAAGK